MKQCVAYGSNSKKIYAKGTEADIHRELNSCYPSYQTVENRQQGKHKETLVDPIYPVIICIKKVDD